MNNLELLRRIEKRKSKEKVIRFYYNNLKLAYSGGRILMATDLDGNVINRRPEWAELSAEAKIYHSYVYSKFIIEEENNIISLLKNKGIVK